MVGIGGTAELPLRLGGDTVLPHEFGHGVDAAASAACHKLLVDARAPIALLELLMDGLDLCLQNRPLLLLRTGRADPPGVVAAGRDLQDLAHQPHRPLAAVFLDEAVLHSDSLA